MAQKDASFLTHAMRPVLKVMKQYSTVVIKTIVTLDVSVHTFCVFAGDFSVGVCGGVGGGVVGQFYGPSSTSNE